MTHLSHGRIVGPLFLLVCLFAVFPAFSQSDLSGEWAPMVHEDNQARLPGSAIGDYTGLPINDAGRLRADTWNASSLSQPDWQCRPHAAHYGWRGTGGWRIWREVDPVTESTVAIHAKGLRHANRVIYMDGRPHPPESARHTWVGFSTGRWEGDSLIVRTTHLKEAYIQRNGVPQSDLATMTEHWTRHGDYLTVVSILHDPVYLEEPFIQTTNLTLSLRPVLEKYTCDVREEIDRPKDAVPHYLPGTNPYLEEFLETKASNLPGAWAVKGGAESTYPDYKLKLTGAVPPTAPANEPAFARVDSTRTTQDQIEDGVGILPIRGHLYMITGAGGNITVSVGDDGVLLVDSGTSDLSDKVMDAVQKIQAELKNNRVIRYIINTSLDSDHTGGNANIAAEGGDSTGVRCPRPGCADGAPIYAHENVLLRMTQAGEPFPMLPSDTYYTGEMKLSQWFNGEGIKLISMPGHTDGDTVVHFRGSDVISSGDIYMIDGYPVIDLENGGTIQGVIAGLNRILEIAVPDEWAEGGTLIVPGHGRLSDSADVAYYRDMVTVIRDRVQDMIDKEMTLEQVKAAKPTRDYDPRYGATTGPWTTDKFVEAVYQSLKN